MDKKYIYDAEKLITHAHSNSRWHKDIIAKTSLPNQIGIPTLPIFRNIQDGFKNLVSGLGGLQAKNTYTTYRTNFCISDQLLYSLFISHGLSYRVISAITEDATKNDIKIKNDIDSVLFNKWEDLDAIEKFSQADIYRRHFGGSIIYMDIDDGKNLEEPLNENNIKSIRKLQEYSRTDVFFTNVHFTEDFRSPNYGQPEYYTIIPKYTTPFNVHYTRVLEFKGRAVPSHLDNGYRYYWGQSEIEILWETFKKVGSAIENLDQLLYEMTISIYKIKGLADLIASKDWDTIKDIIDQTELAKSTIRSLLLDADGNEYSRDSLSFPGVKDVMEILFMLLTGESGVPFIRLFGKQAGGLNNDGEGELKGYYDKIKVWQKRKLRKSAQRLIDLINMSKEIGNKKIKDPLVQFNSPYQLSEKEELENKKIQSEIDDIYVNKIGSMDNREIRELRHENDYSYDMNVSELESYNENMIEETEEEKKQQQEYQQQLLQMQQQQEGNNKNKNIQVNNE